MMFDKDRGIGPIPNSLAVFGVIIVITVGFLLVSSRSGTEFKQNFTNENYGLSISYPEGWNLDNRQFMGLYMVLITENISEDNQVKAKVQVSTGNLGLPSLENVRDQITTSIENNENVTLLGDLEDVTIDGIPGIDLSARTTTAQGVYRVRQIVLVSENSQYFINSTVMDNSYENFKSDIESIIDSFSTV